MLMLINVLLLVLGCLADIAPPILITTPILLVSHEVRGRSGSFRHDQADEARHRALPSAGRARPCRLAVRSAASAWKTTCARYGVMFLVLMLVTHFRHF